MSVVREDDVHLEEVGEGTLGTWPYPSHPRGDLGPPGGSPAHSV
jgi:hypothetical protein